MSNVLPPCRFAAVDPFCPVGVCRMLCTFDTTLPCPLDPRECATCLLRVPPDEPAPCPPGVNGEDVPAPEAPLVLTTGSGAHPPRRLSSVFDR
jgi:hypothetical protein